METLINLNGVISPAAEAKVSVMDRGFLFGDGVYEAGRSYDRCFLYLEEHWERFRRSAEKLAIEIPWTDQHLTGGLHQVAAATGQENVCFRTIVTRGAVDRVGLEVGARCSPTLAHVVFSLPAKLPKQREQGVALLTSHIWRNAANAQDPNIKTSNYLNSLLALQDVKKRGGEDAILCDAKGNVTEGTNFSIFGVTDKGTVITPDLGVGILDSITRRHVIEIARKIGLVESYVFPLSVFHQCSEIFMASSTREICPVRRWDGVNYQVNGPVTRKLQSLLSDEIYSYVKSHPKY